MRTLKPGPHGYRKPWVATALLLAACVVVAYFPGVHGGFIFDDYPNIIDNTRVQVDHLTATALSSAAFSSEAGTLQRPLAMLTFALNHYFTGLDGAAMKWTNIAIHATNAILVFGLVQLVLALGAPAVPGRRRRWAAGFAAAAWALQPINFFGVLYIVQRMESLSHLFVFGGLWLYLAGRQRQLRGEGGHWPMGIGLVGGTSLALLCKESGVLLPLYAWLLEMCLPALRNAADRRRVQLLFLTVLWLPCVAGLAWLMPYVLRPETYASRDFTLAERLLTEPRVLLDYVRWTLFPRIGEFGLYHDDYVVSRSWLAPATLLSAIGIALLVAFAWSVRGRRPVTALGLLWFLAAHALTATVIPLEIVYEHRNYFASLGLCLVLVDLLVLWPEREPARRIGALLMGCAILYYGATTHLRAREWSEPLRFARIEALKHPGSPRATFSYGRMLVIASNYDPRSPYLAPAIATLEKAGSLPGSGVLPHSALLLAAAHTNSPVPDQWWDTMATRLRENPVGPQEINAIGSLVRCSRESECRFPPARMVALFEAALARKPVADIYALYGDYMLNVLDRPDEAIAMSRRSVALRPTIAQYRLNLGIQLVYMCRIEEAMQEVAALRAMGRLGQNEAAAVALEQRIAERSCGPT